MQVTDLELLRWAQGRIEELKTENTELKAELARFKKCDGGFCTDGTGDICYEGGKHMWTKVYTMDVYHREGS